MIGAAALAAWVAGPVLGQAPAHVVERPDGSRVDYYLERRSARGRQPLLLMLQGSGCDSVAANPRIRWMAPQIGPRFAVLTIEKYGVADGSDGDDCTPEYWRGNTLNQRVLDALQVIARLRGEGWWNRELVVFGGSEGGAVAAMLAPLVPETKAVVIWSSGIGLPVGELVRQAIPEAIRTEATNAFAAARTNPSPDLRWGGASYRWWADAIDLVAARSLVQTPSPVLIVHGTRDASAPVSSARAARDLIVAAGKRNFTYREYEGFDHFMFDAAGRDRRTEVLAEIAAWLRRVD